MKTAQEIRVETSELTKRIVILDKEAKEIGQKLHDNRNARKAALAQRAALFGEAKQIRRQEADVRAQAAQSKAAEKAQKAIDRAKALKEKAKAKPSKDFSELTPKQLEDELKNKKPAKTVAAKRARKPSASKRKK